MTLNPPDPEADARTWIEIDSSALEHNFQQFRSKLASHVKMGAVVKSNAYGHDLLGASQVFDKAGADWFCVNSLDEALALRSANIKAPILVMGWIPPQALPQLVDKEIRPVIYEISTVKALAELSAQQNAKIPLHLKLETGTNRQGLLPADWSEVLDVIKSAPNLSLEGVYTHFANIEDTTDHRFAERQLERFKDGLNALEQQGFNPELRHTACSAAAMLFTKTHFDLVRLGIALYGIWPSRETLASSNEISNVTWRLRPALTWKTRVAQVKNVPEGEFVSYGCTHRTTRNSRIAVLPVGYFEGYPRSLSGLAHVLIKGRRAPVLGRICMNLCMVDVTDHASVFTGDEVVLLGVEGDDGITAEKVANWAGTIPYEILSRIHPSLPRIYI